MELCFAVPFRFSAVALRSVEKTDYESFKCCVGLTAARVQGSSRGMFTARDDRVVMCAPQREASCSLCMTRLPPEYCIVAHPTDLASAKGLLLLAPTYPALSRILLTFYVRLKTSRTSLTCSTTTTPTTQKTTSTVSAVPVVLVVWVPQSLCSLLTVSAAPCRSLTVLTDFFRRLQASS